MEAVYKGERGRVFTFEVLAGRVLEEPHPLVDTAKLPLSRSIGMMIRLHTRQHLLQPLDLPTPLPEPIHDDLLIPDNAITLAIPRRGGLDAGPETDHGRPPRRSRGPLLLQRHRRLGELDELRALLGRQHVVERQGNVPRVLRQRRVGKVDGVRSDGLGGGSGEEGGRDGDGVVRVCYVARGFVGAGRGGCEAEF